MPPTNAIDIDEDFESLEAARHRFDELRQDNNLFVYLMEIGIYANDNDSLVFDYIIYDTNNYDWWRGVSSTNRLGTRGFGIPGKNQVYATRYTPTALISWEL